MFYTKTVKYQGFNNQMKERVLQFILTRKDALDNPELFEKYENQVLILQQIASQDGTLTSQQALELIEIVLSMIKLSYAEIDLENDVIDKSEETKNRFINSLAYEALLSEITDRPEVALEIVEGIGTTLNLNETEKSKQEELREQFVERTTRQNDDKSGLTLVEAVADHERRADEGTQKVMDRHYYGSTDEEVMDLRRRLAELEGVDQ